MWITAAVISAFLFWSLTGAVAIVGMAGAKFGAPGLSPRDGYKQDVLSQSVRDMQLWVIASHAGTLAAGQVASDRLRSFLNTAIVLLVAAPVISLAIAALGSLFS